MRPTRKSVFLSVLLVCLLTLPARQGLGQRYPVRTFSVEAGLAQSQVAAIFQDRQGYLWFGTYGGGVSRYDGIAFVNFSTREGLSNNIVYAIHQDKAGVLWFATEGGLCTFDGERFHPLQSPDLDLNVAVWTILEDDNGDLWFGTQGLGLLRYDGERFTQYVDDRLRHEVIRALVRDPSGQLWLGTDTGVKTLRRSGSGYEFEEFEPLRGKSVWAILLDRTQRFWFGTEGAGLFRYSASGVDSLGTADGLASNKVYVVYEDRRGIVWLGTEDGVNRFEGDEIRLLTTAHGYSNNNVRSIFEDREGNHWFGTWGGGVDKCPSGRLVHFTTEHGLSSNLVMSIHQDRNGMLWVGTWGGGLNRFDGERFVHYSTQDGLGSDEIYSICEDRHGHLWFATQNGLTRYDGTRFTTYTSKDGLGSNRINVVYPDSRGDLWVGTWGGGVSRFDGKTFTTYTVDDGLLDNEVFSIFEDNRGDLWFGTWIGGLSRLTWHQTDGVRQPIFTNVMPDSALKNKAVLGIQGDRHGCLWLGTYGGGVIRYNPGQADSSRAWDYINTDDGLSDDAVLFLIFDEEGRLWCGTNKGLNRLDVNEYERSGNLRLKHYARPEGFEGIECNQSAAARDSKGYLWFGTIKGLTRYDPRLDFRNHEEPITNITRVLLFLEEVDWDSETEAPGTSRPGIPSLLSLPYDKNHLTFEYVGISLTAPEKVTYQFMLEGFDQNWSPVTRQTRATYSNLPPGDYVFKVKAANNDGVWNAQPTTLRVHISSPFWQTWWFYGLMLGLCALGITGVIKYRTAQLERQRIYLEREVESRTRELKTINAELEKLSLVASETDNGVIIADAEGRVEWVNEGFTRMTGYTLEELRRERGRTLVEISAHPRLSRLIKRSVSRRTSIHYETVSTTRKGEQRWVASTLTPIFDASGALHKLVVIDTDITVRKQTEQALKESQTRLKLLNSIATGMRTGMSMEEVIKRTVALIHDYFPNYRVAYATIDNKGGVRVIHSLQPSGMPDISDSQADLHEAEDYWRALQSDRPVVVEDVRQDPRLAPLCEALLHIKTLAVLDVPVMYSGDLVGLLCFGAPTPHVWNRHEINTLKEISDYLTLLLNEAALQEKRRQAEREVQIQKAYFEQLFQCAPEAIVILNREDRVLHVNPEFSRMFGYSVDEVIGQPINDLIVPAELRQEALSLSREVTDSHNVQVETRRCRKDGSLVDVSILGTPILFEGGQVGIYGIYRDITERKRAEEKRRQSEEKFRKLFHQSNDGIFIHDLEGNILDVNQKALEQFGYEREELLALKIKDLHPAETADSPRERFAQIREKGFIRFETEFVRKDRTRFSAEVSASLFEVAGRQLVQGIVRDITERKRAEVALQQAKEAAEAANRSKSEFLANMSHEIRTPLNAIIGMTELALETDLNDEQREFLRVVQSSSESLLGLINDILDFSKIEAGQMELESVPFNLRELVENVADIFGVKAAAKRLELLCYMDPQLPSWYVGDPTRIRQILINLVGNAIKFTETGEVALHVVAARRRKRGKKQTLHFRVSDTGIGISKAHQRKIFEKFTQADTSTTRKFGGTGLGLSISSSLVELMNGRMWIESQVGRGTTFHFTVTLAEAAGTDEEERHYNYPDFKTISVLLVDDNETNRQILRKTFESWGATVAEAGNGPEALERLREPGTHFDLIVLDHQMPQMDGIAVAQAIRSELKLEEVKIVLLSSWGRLDRKVLDQWRVQEAITKPVKQSRLMDLVLRTLRTERTQKTVSAKRTAPAAVPRPGSRFKILLVEDNPDNQNLATKILEKAGYATDLAENGCLAVQAATRFQYDLILMDVQMPLMDGFEATQEIRRLEKEQNRERVPIVALTAHALQGYREKCLQHDMDDYITKPLKKKVLLDTVAKWIDPRPVILVADDSPDNRNLIGNYLKNTYFRLVLVNNGKEAVEVCKSRRVSLVLLDMEMPVMNGYEAAAAIRALPGFGETPIVAMTAHQGAAEVRKCNQAGCSEYLPKPIRKKRLLETLTSLLDEPRVVEPPTPASAKRSGPTKVNASDDA